LLISTFFPRIAVAAITDFTFRLAMDLPVYFPFQPQPLQLIRMFRWPCVIGVQSSLLGLGCGLEISFAIVEGLHISMKKLNS